MRDHGLERERQPKIIALTGHTESEFFFRAFKKRIDQVYSKPVTSDQVKLILLESGFRVSSKFAKI